MSRLKKKLDETDLVYSDLFDDEIEDKIITAEDEMKKKHQHILAFVAGALAVVIIAFAVVKSNSGSDNEKLVENSTTVPEVTEENNNLVADQYPEITDLVTMYYDAKLKGDTASLEKFVDNLEEVNMDSITASNKYVKNYKNIETYTKPGLDDDTYVVFVYYEIKFKNITTTAPGIDVLYVKRDSETGLVYIHNGATSNREIKNYIQGLAEDEDVAALYSETNDALKEALNSDSDLKKLYKSLQSGIEEAETTTKATSKKANSSKKGKNSGK